MLGEAGEAVILVRHETAAEDFPGMERSRGILTARGGMTSHAAVVARGNGLAGGDRLRRAGDRSRSRDSFRAGDAVVREGDVITIDGTTGEVHARRGPDDRGRPGRSCPVVAALGRWHSACWECGPMPTPRPMPRGLASWARAVSGSAAPSICSSRPAGSTSMRRMILAQSDEARCEALDSAGTIPDGRFRRNLPGDGWPAGHDPVARSALA